MKKHTLKGPKRATKKNYVVRKQRHRKTRSLAEIYQRTKPIGEKNNVAGPTVEERLAEQPQIGMSTRQSGGGSVGATPMFQVVNIIEDLNTEEEEDDDEEVGTIRIRRRKQTSSRKW